jgi:hypothetical protein
MHRFVPVIVLAAAVIVTGCDGKKSDNKANHVDALTTKVDMGGGQSATINSKVPANLPAYAKLYDGADVLSVMKMPAAGGMPASVMIQYNVNAKPEDVLAFYKKLSAEAGFETTFDKKVGPTEVFKGQAKDGDEYVAVNITDTGGQASVNESYN